MLLYLLFYSLYISLSFKCTLREGKRIENCLQATDFDRF